MLQARQHTANSATTPHTLTLLLPACCAGRPVDSGISLQVVRELGPDFPLFGVCMGHQCIGEAFGGQWRSRAVAVAHVVHVAHAGSELRLARPAMAGLQCAEHWLRCQWADGQA